MIISMNKIIKQIIIITITAVMSSVITLGVVMANNFSLDYAKKIILENYYGGVDKKALEEGALDGMVASLGDEHSTYIGSEFGYDTFAREINGEFSGIGVSILATEENRSSIVSVFSGTPAEKAGLKNGDVFLEVNGKGVEFAGVQAIADAVMGEIGTSVNIKVERDGTPLSFDIVREKIYVPTINKKTFENFGYIQVTSFDQRTDEDFKAALDELKDKDGLIIDLRNNTGGLLDTTVNMLDMLINEGTLIQTRYNDGEINYTAKGTQVYDKPVVVLVNELSASASEFFSAAIKENNRGEVVGVNTYGKGSIQTTFRLPDNRGIHLTIGRFYSPEGNEINGVGVAPTYEVENPEEYQWMDVDIIPFEEDLQLKKALDVIKTKK